MDRFLAALLTSLVILGSIGNGICAGPRSAYIADLKAFPKNGDLTLSFRIENCFTKKMEDAIKSGVPTTFRILIVLEEPGLPLFRKQLVKVTFEHTIKYEQLSNEYRLKLDELNNDIFVAKDFEEARKRMSQIKSLPIIPLWQLERGRRYNISVKAELSKIRMPPFLRYVLFFVSLWDFQTDWQRIQFQY